MAKRHVRQVPSEERPPPQSKVLNRLLASLPPGDYARLSPALAIVPLELKKVLHKPGDAIQDLYFPGSGFCSIVTVLQDGGMVEIATVGREGVVGISAVLNDGPSPSAAMVQAESDTCYRLPVRAFRDETNRDGSLSKLMTRYANAFMGVVMQGTACNAVHSVEQRLARWLLLARDRVGRNDFPLTQEFVAMMLGVTRPSVSVVAAVLQKAGLITYHRGHVTIVDGERLEAASCECYRVTTDLMGSVLKKAR